MPHRRHAKRRLRPVAARAARRVGLTLLLAMAVVVGIPVGRDALVGEGPSLAGQAGQAALPTPGLGAGTGNGDSAGVTAAEPSPVLSRSLVATTVSPPLTKEARDALARTTDARVQGRVGERWLTAAGQLTGYIWPLAHGRVTQPFGPNWAGTLVVHGQLFHDGLDIATFCGDRVVAAHDGIVLAAGRKVDPWMGWIGSLEPSVRRRDHHHLWYSLPIIVVVDDGNGYRSIYAHFNAIAVHAGQRVRAGQFLGWEGATGFATGCHVHYGLFNPLETGRMQLRPDVVKRTKLPKYEIARIDPLLVLPSRAQAGGSDTTVGPAPSPTVPPDVPRNR